MTAYFLTNINIKCVNYVLFLSKYEYYKMISKYEKDMLALFKTRYPDIYNELDKQWRIDETNRRLESNYKFRCNDKRQIRKYSNTIDR